MKTAKLLLTCALLATAQNVFCQDFEVPENYQFNTADDYALYEKDIIAAAKWLEATPFNEQEDKRNEVEKFVWKWVEGSPTVNVEINETILEFDKKNPGMMILYAAGCARYVLENNYSKDMRAKHKFALGVMIRAYKAGKGMNKDKNMDALVKAEADGKLDAWLDKNLKIEK